MRQSEYVLPRTGITDDVVITLNRYKPDWQTSLLNNSSTVLAHLSPANRCKPPPSLIMYFVKTIIVFAAAVAVVSATPLYGIPFKVASFLGQAEQLPTIASPTDSG